MGYNKLLSPHSSLHLTRSQVESYDSFVFFVTKITRLSPMMPRLVAWRIDPSHVIVHADLSLTQVTQGYRHLFTRSLSTVQRPL